MGSSPALELRETGGRCRLSLGGLARGERGDAPESALGRPDADELSYVWELGEMAARGEDIRARVFGFD
jgi:hypothetical protein